MKTYRVYLSPPYLSGQEKKFIQRALDSNWVAPSGPIVKEFEEKLEALYPDKRVLALNSGTSALHMANILSSLHDREIVGCNSLTFAALANSIIYENHRPLFLDADIQTWNTSYELTKQAILENGIKRLFISHCYGNCSGIERIALLCKENGVVLIEDAAGAIGARINTRYAGGFGDFGVLSFNGNKTVTTGGGGALILENDFEYERALHLSNQARVKGADFEHDDIGYNYRMSSVLAAIGLAQLETLNERLERKKSINEAYQEAFQEYPIVFQKTETSTSSNYWLSSFLLPDEVDIHCLIDEFDNDGIEVRKLWKPLQSQKTYGNYEALANGNADFLYQKGLSLPSGVGLKDDEQKEIIDVVRRFLDKVSS